MAVENPRIGGGGLTVNTETLTGDKTLVDGDENYQLLNTNNVNRTLTLPATGGSTKLFVIKNTDLYSRYIRILIRTAALSTLDYVYPGCTKEFVWNGTAWEGADMATASLAPGGNIAFGENAKTEDGGIAIGQQTTGRDSVAIGDIAIAQTSNAVAIGASANAASISNAIGGNATSTGSSNSFGNNAESSNYGVALGRDTEANFRNSVALGALTECIRGGGVDHKISKYTSDASQIGFQGFYDTFPAEAVPTFRLLPVENITDGRCTIPARCFVKFKGTLVAIDSNMNTAEWEIEARIKRDNANNTTLVSSLITNIHKDVAGWDVQISADDVNEALQIDFKGNDSDTDNYQVTVGVNLRYTQVKYL